MIKQSPFMKNYSVQTFLLFLFIILPFSILAQENEIKMADVMRSNGKIYVVVAAILVILAGLLIFLIRIDKKVNRLEKKSKKV